MPKGLSQYAIVEVDFVDHPKLAGMTSGQSWTYLCIWLWAVRQRREWVMFRSRSAHRMCIRKGFCADHERGMITRTIAKCLESGLLEMKIVDGDSWLKVCGVRAKHKAMQRWETENDAFIEGHSPLKKRGDLGPLDKEKERDKEQEQKKPSSSIQQVSSPRSKVVAPPKSDDDGVGAIAPGRSEKSKAKRTVIQDDWVVVFDAWQSCVGRILSSADIERITEMITTYGEKAVANAIVIAHEHNARSLAYMQRVLENGKVEDLDASKYPNAFRNARGRIVRDSKGVPMTPKKGLIPKWDDAHMDIVGWNKRDN